MSPSGDDLPRCVGLSIDLPAVAASAGVARGALAGVLQRGTDSGARDTAALLLTELVTNAARHVGGTMHVEVDVEQDTVRVAVCDSSPYVPGAAGLPGWESESGRGLFLIETLSDRWGADALPEGKRIWFELATHARTAS